jgi:leader peptidase (prepilin peptidase)/N-methyltransferase
MVDTPASVAEVLRALGLVWGAMVGACLGSFANVVVARVPLGQSVVHPPSRCPHCGVPIRAWHNIPVLSWLWLRGRARCCGAPISARYVVVELVGMGLGWAVVALDGMTPQAMVHGLSLLFLVCVALIDAEHWIIPEGLSVGLLVTGAAGGLAAGWWAGGGLLDTLKAVAVHSGAGALLGFTVLWAFRKVGTFVARRTGRVAQDEEAQGEGDEQLMAGVGAVVGAAGVWWTLMLGSAAGAAVGLTLAAVGSIRGAKRQPAPVPDPTGQDEDWTPPPGALPFGPYLALGAAVTIFATPWLPPLGFQALVDLLTASPT